MINLWLNYQRKSSTYIFTVIEVSENQKINNTIKKILQKEILDSYRDLKFLKYRYEKKSHQELRDYLENEVLPSMIDQFSKNVWQGDFGEILANSIVSYFQKLTVPLKKIRWKLNKEKSLFATDMVAHNSDEKITDMYYYEIKTQQNFAHKRETKYITVIAYESLKKEENTPNNEIADFLSRQFFEKQDYKNAEKYGNVVSNSIEINRHFELFFIGEKSSYIEDILIDLDSLPPELSPLNITIVLIDNFKELVANLRKTITTEAVNIVYNI
jgi:hypothetical protein